MGMIMANKSTHTFMIFFKAIKSIMRIISQQMSCGRKWRLVINGLQNSVLINQYIPHKKFIRKVFVLC